MNTRSRRRCWVLPVFLALLAVWSLAVVVSFAAFGGPTGPVAWLQIGAVFVALVLLVSGELMSRRKGN